MSWAARVVMPLAYHVLYGQGQHEAAVARIDDALAVMSGRSRHRAVMLSAVLAAGAEPAGGVFPATTGARDG